MIRKILLLLFLVQIARGGQPGSGSVGGSVGGCASCGGASSSSTPGVNVFIDVGVGKYGADAGRIYLKETVLPNQLKI